LQREIIEAYESYQFHLIYQKLHNFCSNDLGGFYLDVIKDRQYTTQTDSVARRSAQTAMYHIGEALARWVGPIMSFTAEEIWENLPGERPESVLLSQWYEGLAALPDDIAMGRDYWQQAMAVRTAVNREMESQRAEGVLRGSLDAEVVLYCTPELLARLDSLGDELRFVLITSKATLAALGSAPADSAETELEGLRLQVAVSTDEKCERCWHRRPDVGQIADHATLCGRCVENIEGDGEQRHFA
jgi:isoleucyl-tRNA synthetase